MERRHGPRRPPPPWERYGHAASRHPTGRVRRRWPRAYDGAAEPEERRRGGGPRVPRRRRESLIEQLRRHPVRHGMVGLAIAGTAIPVAMGRQQAAERTNPSHEQVLGSSPGATPLTDAAVANAWRAASAEAAVAPVSAEAQAASAREAAIERNMARYARYDVSRDLAEKIVDAALEADVDVDMAFGLVRAESSFKNTATSHVGARGLTQLMPKTAQWIEPGVTTTDLRNPDVNLRIGFRYLKDLLSKYDQDEHLALLAYNRGPGTVDRVLKRGGNPDNGYPDMVFRDVR